MGKRFHVLCLGSNEYRLGLGVFTIGRSSECNLPLEDPRVSRLHAVIRVGEDGAVVQDAGSSNGTFVNGELVERAQPLNDGDTIEIGETELTVRVAEQFSARRPRSREETLPVLPSRDATAASNRETARVPKALSRLSQREMEVMRLVARGYTHKEIAERLGLSHKTVEGYRARIGDKLGLKTRAELVQLALDAKMLGS